MSFVVRFRGLRALVQSKRDLLWVSFVFALLGGFVFGLGERLGFVSRLDSELLPVIVAILAVAAPVGAAYSETLRTQGSGRSNREVLLTSPLGPWALPAHVHLTSALWLGALALGLAPALALFGVPATGAEVLKSLAVGALAWLGSSYAVAVGANSAQVVLPALIVPLFWCMTALSAGYSKEQSTALVVWCLGLAGIGSLLLFALPYFFYGRPSCLWQEHLGTSPASSLWRGAAVVLAGGALVLIGFFGLAWSLILALPAALCAHRASRASRPRRWKTHAGHSLRILCALYLPCLALGLAYDAHYFREGGRYDPAHHTVGVDAPAGGRRVVLLADKLGGWHYKDGTHLRWAGVSSLGRVAVVGAEGQVEVLLDMRFGALAHDAWSSDGRYVAVTDLDAGRVPLSYPRSVSRTRRGDTGDFCERLVAQAVLETVIVDTQTGEVSRIPLAELRPGWTTPAELVHHALGRTGQHVLSDGRGRRVEVDEDELFLVRYTPAGPVIHKAGSDYLLGEAGLEPLAPR